MTWWWIALGFGWPLLFLFSFALFGPMFFTGHKMLLRQSENFSLH